MTVVKSLVLALSTEPLVFIPVVIDANCTQVEDGLGTGPSPAHTGLLHAVLDEMTASALDDASANGPSLSQVLS